VRTLLSGFHYLRGHCVRVCVCVIEELKSLGLAHPIAVKLGKVRTYKGGMPVFSIYAAVAAYRRRRYYILLSTVIVAVRRRFIYENGSARAMSGIRFLRRKNKIDCPERERRLDSSGAYFTFVGTGLCA